MGLNALLLRWVCWFTCLIYCLFVFDVCFELTLLIRSLGLRFRRLFVGLYWCGCSCRFAYLLCGWLCLLLLDLSLVVWLAVVVRCAWFICYLFVWLFGCGAVSYGGLGLFLLLCGPVCVMLLGFVCFVCRWV